MDLTSYVDTLRHELAVAAEAGGEDARALAERLTAPLESAVRLAPLGALAAGGAGVNPGSAPRPEGKTPAPWPSGSPHRWSRRCGSPCWTRCRRRRLRSPAISRRARWISAFADVSPVSS